MKRKSGREFALVESWVRIRGELQDKVLLFDPVITHSFCAFPKDCFYCSIFNLIGPNSNVRLADLLFYEAEWFLRKDWWSHYAHEHTSHIDAFDDVSFLYSLKDVTDIGSVSDITTVKSEIFVICETKKNNSTCFLRVFSFLRNLPWKYRG